MDPLSKLRITKLLMVSYFIIPMIYVLNIIKQFKTLLVRTFNLFYYDNIFIVNFTINVQIYKINIL